MVGFTEYLNNIFQFNYKIKSDKGDYKSFFSTRENFYKLFIRRLKLKQLIND